MIPDAQKEASGLQIFNLAMIDIIKLCKVHPYLPPSVAG
jgi:hypothetical protein